MDGGLQPSLAAGAAKAPGLTAGPEPARFPGPLLLCFVPLFTKLHLNFKKKKKKEKKGKKGKLTYLPYLNFLACYHNHTFFFFAL